MSLYDMPNAIKYWGELLENANWSKCVYTYGAFCLQSRIITITFADDFPGTTALATCLYQSGGEENTAKARKLMAEVPGLMQRIAGRSIPLEVRPLISFPSYLTLTDLHSNPSLHYKKKTQKYAARKARKFEKQAHRLLLPHLELAYHLLCVTRAPRSVIVKKMLPDVEAAVARVDAARNDEERRAYEAGGEDGKGEGKGGYWDDYCLAHFLHAVCLRYTAYAVSLLFFRSFCASFGCYKRLGSTC